jgi:chromosome partitioning protein
MFTSSCSRHDRAEAWEEQEDKILFLALLLSSSYNPRMRKSTVIVIGNEKGGSGKSTLAIHLAVAYMHSGYKVATIDLDGRQGTLTHYIENRSRYIKDRGLSIPMPEHLVVTPSTYSSQKDAGADEEQLDLEIAELKKDYDIIIIDTPGTYNHLSNAGHKNADILISPVNDSLVDIDVMATFDSKGRMVAESQYSKNVQDIDVLRRELGKKPVKWFLIRNRISPLSSKNKREVDEALRAMEGQLGFTYIGGMSERVVYREMFLKGLTVLDMLKMGGDAVTISHVAAKGEITEIMGALGLTVKL